MLAQMLEMRQLSDELEVTRGKLKESEAALAAAREAVRRQAAEVTDERRGSWWKVPSALFDDSAPSTRLVPCTAQAVPTHPRAQPEPLGSVPWPRELDLNRPQGEDSRLADRRELSELRRLLRTGDGKKAAGGADLLGAHFDAHVLHERGAAPNLQAERLLQQLQESFAQLQAQSLQLDEARGALAQAQRQRVQEVHQLQVASGADAQLHRREVAEALAAAQAALRSCEQQLEHRQAALAQASAPRAPPRRFRSPILSAHRSHRPR